MTRKLHIIRFEGHFALRRTETITLSVCVSNRLEFQKHLAIPYVERPTPKIVKSAEMNPIKFDIILDELGCYAAFDSIEVYKADAHRLEIGLYTGISTFKNSFIHYILPHLPFCDNRYWERPGKWDKKESLEAIDRIYINYFIHNGRLCAKIPQPFFSRRLREAEPTLEILSTDSFIRHENSTPSDFWGADEILYQNIPSEVSDRLKAYGFSKNVFPTMRFKTTFKEVNVYNAPALNLNRDVFTLAIFLQCSYFHPMNYSTLDDERLLSAHRTRELTQKYLTNGGSLPSKDWIELHEICKKYCPADKHEFENNVAVTVDKRDEFQIFLFTAFQFYVWNHRMSATLDYDSLIKKAKSPHHELNTQHSTCRLDGI